MGPEFDGLPAHIVTDRQIALSDSVGAIGAFDGVHPGHQTLIRTAIAQTRAGTSLPLSGPSTRPPKVFFSRARQLSPLQEKLARIARFGPDWIVIASFHALYARRSPQNFIADLARINPRRIHVGADFRFGCKQVGDVAQLAQHFDLALTRSACCKGGQVISSSRIRALKAAGQGDAIAPFWRSLWPCWPCWPWGQSANQGYSPSAAMAGFDS